MLKVSSVHGSSFIYSFKNLNVQLNKFKKFHPRCQKPWICDIVDTCDFIIITIYDTFNPATNILSYFIKRVSVVCFNVGNPLLSIRFALCKWWCIHFMFNVSLDQKIKEKNNWRAAKECTFSWTKT